jgi:molecular chaperone IbpA
MIDFAPFYRSTVGFDRMFDMLDGLSRPAADHVWPPYDIERVGDDQYRITVAVPGFARDDLWVIAGPNGLLVEGRPNSEDDQRVFLHQAIARRPFRHEFHLADFVKVVGATMDNGLLVISLEREIPEAMKPRRVTISASADKRDQTKTHQTLDGSVAGPRRTGEGASDETLSNFR